MIKVSVVIPMYNEHSLIADTLNQLKGMCCEPYEWELIFSNDGSNDGCEEIIAADSDERVKLVNNCTNRGKGAAIREGILASSGDIVVYTDCDLAYGTQQVMDIISAHEKNNADITIGSRKRHPDGYAGYTPFRKFVSRVYLRIITVVAGCRVSDSQTGLKCFNGEAARDIFSRCQIDRFAFDLEALTVGQRLGYTISEFPVRIIRSDQELGRTSSIHFFKDSLRMLIDIFKMRRRLSHGL